MAEEALASSAICDITDPTLLTSKEIQDEWGSCMNFFISYGLRPWKEGDCEAALSISRALKKGNNNNDSRGGRKEGNQFGVGKSGGVCYDPSLLVTRYKELLQEINCPICFEVLKIPYETKCCRKLICGSCQQALQNQKSCCPFCRRQRFLCYQNVPAREMLDKITSLLEVIDPVYVEATEMKKKEEEARRKREQEERKRREEEERRRKDEEERRKREEEEHRKREQEKKRKREQEEKNQTLRWERGESWLPWMDQKNFDYLKNYTRPGDLKCFSYLNNGCIFVLQDGTCAWAGLPDGRLKSLLSGRGRGMTKLVDLLSVVENPVSGELSYYLRFADGSCYWGLPNYLDGGFQATLDRVPIVDISLGLSCQGGFQFVAKVSDGTVFGIVEGVDNKWLSGGLDAFLLGGNGEYFLRRGEQFVHSHLPGRQFREVRRLRGRIKRAFISSGRLLLTYN